MKKYQFSLIAFLLVAMVSNAQVSINTDNSNSHSSAMLDVKSTAKGLLPPRMTYLQRNAIVGPAEGLVVFCSNCTQAGTGCISMYYGGQWLNLIGNCELPATPAEGSLAQTNTQITWNWATVPIADGYKWHTTNNVAAATDLGTTTTHVETGLTQGTSYTRYVWAYNNCGYSEPLVLQGQALACGTSFSRSHSAGATAPVSKTVSYGTVTNIPGEVSKCWITRNLGATQPPLTANDNSEAAAGWYWQFNRMQGYKHDGTTLTPSWTLTSISENLNWESVNDPCSILLGSAWRIPTFSEWNNVRAAGSWTNPSGPFNSGLQMHTAGYLQSSSGSLSSRGTYGAYWSSEQSAAGNGFNLDILVSYTSMAGNPKAHGFSVRCVRD